MSKVRFTLNILAVVLFTMTVSSLAQAQATRTWVSGVGDDVNPCSRTAPCKTFAGAISKTAAGGEIDALDPGGFGAVTITKSMTIDGGATHASILSSATSGVIINITAAADPKIVRLRNLSIVGYGGLNGNPNGLNGIRYLAGNALHVDNTIIDGFTQDGIEVNISSGQGSPAELYLRNVVVRNCTSDAVSLTHANAASVVVASFTDVELDNSGNGINLAARSRATVRGGTFHANTAAINHTATSTESTLFNCSISNNVTGIIAGAAPGISRISQVLIYGNVTSMTGNVKSWGNNYIDGNTTNNLPITPNLQQF